MMTWLSGGLYVDDIDRGKVKFQQQGMRNRKRVCTTEDRRSMNDKWNELCNRA